MTLIKMFCLHDVCIENMPKSSLCINNPDVCELRVLPWLRLRCLKVEVWHRGRGCDSSGCDQRPPQSQQSESNIHHKCNCITDIYTTICYSRFNVVRGFKKNLGEVLKRRLASEEDSCWVEDI